MSTTVRVEELISADVTMDDISSADITQESAGAIVQSDNNSECMCLL